MTTTNLLASEVRMGHWVRIWGWDEFYLSLGAVDREGCPHTNNMDGKGGRCILGHVRILWATGPDNTPPEDHTWLVSDEMVEVLVHDTTTETTA